MDHLAGLMNMDGMHLALVMGMLGGFIAVCLFVTYINYAVLEPYRRRRLIYRRIRSNKKEREFRAQIFKAYQDPGDSPVLTLLHKLTGWSKVDKLQRSLLQADIFLSPAVFISIIGIMGCVGFVITLRLGMGAWAYIAGGPVTGFLPVFVMRWKKARKTAQFEKFMPDAMELLARSLRAGHTLQATLELVSQEIKPPLGKEFRITYEEQKLGLSISQALRRLAERVASQDLRYFVTAVLIQTETGGNLAEILENIGMLIRERLKLKGKIDALTAEGRFSAIILTGMPIAIFLILFFVNRNYVMVLFSNPMGHKILAGAVVSVAFGALVMKKMVTIKV
jgi:tight adherence protein B